MTREQEQIAYLKEVIGDLKQQVYELTQENQRLQTDKAKMKKHEETSDHSLVGVMKKALSSSKRPSSV